MKKRNYFKKREGVQKGFYLLPNLFTTGGIFCGFYSIIATFKENYVASAQAIIIAMFFDALDGKVARYTRTQSKFGIQYDSLCDLVSFGVAPSLLVYSWGLSTWGRLGWLVGFIFLTCGALRLARFNVQFETTSIKHFVGLPIPSAASFIATLVLFIDYIEELKGVHKTHHDVATLIAVFCISLLMVSNIKYFSFKQIDLLKKRPFHVLVLVAFIIAIVVSEPQLTLFIISIIYVSSAPLIYLWTIFKKWKGLPVSKEEIVEEYEDIDEDIEEEPINNEEKEVTVKE